MQNTKLYSEYKYVINLKNFFTGGTKNEAKPMSVLKQGWYDLLVFNGTFSTNRLYRAIGVGNISRRARRQHRYRHIIKQ